MMDAQPIVDAKGIPIYPGDLLRTPHYVGARRKQNYLYHVVVREGEHLYMVPTMHLEPTLIIDGGKCLLKHGMDKERSQIISGYGPSPYITFEDRPRIQTALERRNKSDEEAPLCRK